MSDATQKGLIIEGQPPCACARPVLANTLRAHGLPMCCLNCAIDSLDVVRCLDVVLVGSGANMTRGGCLCQAKWATANGYNLEDSVCSPLVTYVRCGMKVPCDGDNGNVHGQSWCLIDLINSPASCKPDGINWDFCNKDGIYPPPTAPLLTDIELIVVISSLVLFISGFLLRCWCIRKEKQLLAHFNVPLLNSSDPEAGRLANVALDMASALDGAPSPTCSPERP